MITIKPYEVFMVNGSWFFINMYYLLEGPFQTKSNASLVSEYMQIEDQDD
jgi:hypothetical protein